MAKLGIFFGHFEYIMAISNILWPFGTFYGHLVIKWQFGIFPLPQFFGILCHEKSGNPE
jgi:hypothetical protein